MTQALATIPVLTGIPDVRALLTRNQQSIASSLSKAMRPDRFIRVVTNAVMRNPELLGCTARSFYGAVLQCAQLSLEPDGLTARAYLIPRVNRQKKGEPKEVNFQIGYQGLIDLVRRSRQVLTIEAREVYDGDVFDFRYGSKRFLSHRPMGTSTKIVAVYALATLVGGVTQFEVMTYDQVEAHRLKYSTNEKAWKVSWRGMGLKTAAIRLCKFLPQSVELATAIALDERDELGLSQNLEANIPGAEEPFDADSELPPLTDEQKGKLDSLNSMLAQAGKGLNRGQLDDLLGRLGYDGAAEELDDRVRELRASLEKGDKPDKAEKGRRRQAEPESKTEAKVEPKAESKPEPKGDPPATLFTL